jgi:phosphatidylserine/phosphatidylglycerophosphate/cardiolipin synthase-like enzyme
VLSWMQYKQPSLPIRGTVSTPQALPRPPRRGGSGKAGGTGAGKGKTDAADAKAAVPTGMAQTASGLVVPEHLVEAAAAPTAAPQQVAVFQPRKKTPTIIAASALEQGWQEWHKELLKLPDAHAITHSKVIVVDPFGDDPYVLGAASDNLGLKASICNDETMLVIRGNRPLAIAYFVHCMDIYRHFLWRYLVSTGQSTFNGELMDTADWQKKYQGKKARAEYSAMVNGSGLLKKAA